MAQETSDLKKVAENVLKYGVKSRVVEELFKSASSIKLLSAILVSKKQGN